MEKHDWLAEEFEQHRDHLRKVARRLLGSRADADDAVQEAWLRLSRSDVSGVDNLGGWLTTVVSRIAIDLLRARSARTARSASVSHDALEDELADAPGHRDPESEAVLADSVGAALLVVLETLSPAERLAFVLHDTFAVPFADIAGILGRSSAATKQLTHRARTKVRNAGQEPAGVDSERQRRLVEAFLAASRDADVTGIIELLDPGIVMEADDRAVQMGAERTVASPAAVAAVFSGRAEGAVPVVIDGGVGLSWLVKGKARVVWDVVVEGDRITHMNMVADPDTLSRIEITPLST